MVHLLSDCARSHGHIGRLLAGMTWQDLPVSDVIARLRTPTSIEDAIQLVLQRHLDRCR